jgi:hypothetical protein
LRNRRRQDHAAKRQQDRMYQAQLRHPRHLAMRRCQAAKKELR